MIGKYIASVRLNSPIKSSSYLHGLPAIRFLTNQEPLTFTHDVTFFVGDNGTGKSTLLEAVAVAYGFNAEGGSKNFNFSTSQTHSELYQYLTLARTQYAKDGFFLRAESFYNVASNIDEIDDDKRLIESYGGRSLHHQSHGESFLALVHNRFRGRGLYLLDEPEAALSPQRILTLLAEMDRLVKNGSQFIIATHSPILMAFPQAEIYQFTDQGIESIAYKETEHFQLTKRFLENPEKMLSYILDESLEQDEF